MTKKKVFILTILLTPIIAGLYGILHDQLTYTISPEYFTKFKFVQFHIAPALPNRIGATIVGFLATWWMGLIIGLILGLTSLAYKDPNRMFKVLVKSILFTLTITFVFGLFGLAFGKGLNVHSIYFPYELNDPQSFLMVGAMHTGGYIGGFVGLMVSLIYLIRNRKSVD